MNNATNYPLLVFVFSFFVLWLSAWIGRSFRRRKQKLEEDLREDLGDITAATLTLLALIIGDNVQDIVYYWPLTIMYQSPFYPGHLILPGVVYECWSSFWIRSRSNDAHPVIPR